jgi:hypothetical protein
VPQYVDHLELVDDVIKHVIGKYGAYDPAIEYLAKKKDSWLAAPGTDPTASLPTCARISILKNFAGIDVQAMYPVHPADPSLAAGWTYDAFLKAAKACHKAGYPFDMGLGQSL